MSDSSSSSNTGIGFCGALTITFIVLKLCEVINWSWWWVLSPIWIPSAAIIAFVMIALIGIGIWRALK